MSRTFPRPTRSSLPAPQASRATRVARAVLVVAVVAFGVTTIPGVRSSPGFDVRFDGWLQCGGYVLAAAVAAAPHVTRRGLRDPWRWIAASLALRAVGFLVFVLFVRTDPSPSSPSWADAAWLSSSAALLVSLTAATVGTQR